MGKRRFAQVATSDEEEEQEQEEEEPRRSKASASASASREKRRDKKKKKKKIKGGDDDDDDDGGAVVEEEEEEFSSEPEEPERENVQEDAKVIGDVIKVTGKGKRKKNHYSSFEFDGNVFELEDPVLLTPEGKGQKPYVAIIKDITVDMDGNVMVNGQWFYRPEEAEKKGGGKWEVRDTRELFYSWHRDEVPAESVMHRCVVHFIPPSKQLPPRSLHPGFVVQKVYDTDNRKLFKLTDRDYEDHFQQEIQHLIKVTRNRLGELPDRPDPITDDTTGVLKRNTSLRRRPSIDIPKTEMDKGDKRDKGPETPASTNDALKCLAVLTKFEALTGDGIRDKWLDKLVHGLTSRDATGEKERYTAEVVVPSIMELEKRAFEAHTDFQKYNQKMRQLDFNLKNNQILAKRLLNKELDPQIILTMTPNELKAGWTDDEKSGKESDESKPLQMTDARCKLCAEKNVGISEIISGGHGDRYQLECGACGHSWYAARDKITSLTIDVPNVIGNVGAAPWATTKFEEVEKQLASPREAPDKTSTNEPLQKSTAPYTPVLDK
ncbi:bromo-adjacent homology (BAH) domain-containing protein [Carex rostrata]